MNENWRAEAAAWEAKYKMVCGMVEPQYVEAAEKVVKSSIELAAITAQPFERVVDEMVHVAGMLSSSMRILNGIECRIKSWERKL